MSDSEQVRLLTNMKSLSLDVVGRYFFAFVLYLLLCLFLLLPVCYFKWILYCIYTAYSHKNTALLPFYCIKRQQNDIIYIVFIKQKKRFSLYLSAKSIIWRPRRASPTYYYTLLHAVMCLYIKDFWTDTYITCCYISLRISCVMC